MYLRIYVFMYFFMFIFMYFFMFVFIYLKVTYLLIISYLFLGVGLGECVAIVMDIWNASSLVILIYYIFYILL